MNKRKRSVMYALSMFDGSLVKASNSETVSLYVGHCESDRAYVEWKAKLYNSVVGGKLPTVRTYKNNGHGQPVCRWIASDKYLKQIRKDIYRSGVRRFTRSSLDKLDALGLAIWYMDDGSCTRTLNKDGWVSSIGIELSTCCSESEVFTIQTYLKDRWGIDTKVKFGKRQPKEHAYSIRMNTKESRKFFGVIAPHVPKCMLRKMRYFADMSNHERQAPVGSCRDCKTLIYRAHKGQCYNCYQRDYRARKQTTG